MGAALSIFVLLSVSVFIMRIASVALRLTGMAEDSARFQALSAFTGTGFTTSEAEVIVNYPLRRRIISLLMIIGNMGLVTVFATFVVSLISTDGEVEAVVQQVVWLIGMLILFWFFMLNSYVDKVICSVISRVLQSKTLLGRRHFHRMLQIGNGYSICEHRISHASKQRGYSVTQNELNHLGLTILAVRTSDGTISSDYSSSENLKTGDVLVLYGYDEGHDTLERNFYEEVLIND